jgi:hypothetical protein
VQIIIDLRTVTQLIVVSLPVLSSAWHVDVDIIIACKVSQIATRDLSILPNINKYLQFAHSPVSLSPYYSTVNCCIFATSFSRLMYIII